MGARVTGGGSRGRVSNILPAPVPPPLASWAGPAGRRLELPGHYRAGLVTPCRAVPAHGRGCRPKHGHGKRAVPARARNGPGRAGPGLGRAKKTGFRAGHRVTGCMANYTECSSRSSTTGESERDSASADPDHIDFGWNRSYVLREVEF